MLQTDKSEVAAVWEGYEYNPSFAWLTQVMCVKWGPGSYSMGSGLDYDDSVQDYIFCLNLTVELLRQWTADWN